MGGMYAVTPSVVLLDEALPISAKMLYGIIVWSCNQYAYTWASNRTLGAYIGLSAKRTAELIRALEEQGHVETEIVRDAETNQVTARYIYPIVKSGRSLRRSENAPPPKNRGSSPKSLRKKQTPPPKFRRIPPPKKSGVKDQNNKKIIPPIIPPRGMRRKKKNQKRNRRNQVPMNWLRMQNRSCVPMWEKIGSLRRRWLIWSRAGKS